MTEQKTESERKLAIDDRLIQVIMALDEQEMQKKRGFSFSAEYLQEKVAEAKAKYPKLSKFPDSLVKGALLEVIKDEVTSNFVI